jgi:hypothetical protein
MKKKLMLFFMGMAIIAHSQTLNIADTSGKGKAGMFVASSALFIRNFTTADYSFTYGVYGLTNRVDLYAGAAQTTLLGRTQVAASGGANVNLLKKKWISVSNYSILSLPLNSRSDSSKLTLFNAVIASKAVGKVTLYSGYSATLPLGDTQGKLFTPPSVIHNVPVGVMIPNGKFAYFAEYNFGGTVKALGFGVAFTP